MGRESTGERLDDYSAIDIQWWSLVVSAMLREADLTL